MAYFEGETSSRLFQTLDEQALALLLGELGKAWLANNLNKLPKAANMGSLPVTPDTKKALKRACDAVQDLLLQALGFHNAGGVP